MSHHGPSVSSKPPASQNLGRCCAGGDEHAPGRQWRRALWPSSSRGIRLTPNLKLPQNAGRPLARARALIESATMKARCVGLRGLALLAGGLGMSQLVGCSADDATTSVAEAEVEVDDLGGKQDSVSQPLGTYWQVDSATDDYARDLGLLVLRANATFHAEENTTTASVEPARFDGSYKFTKSTSSGKRWVRLNMVGEASRRYEYELSAGGKLSLRIAGSTPWFWSQHSVEEAWCKLTDDCDLQGMKCQGQWSCEEYRCACAPPWDEPVRLGVQSGTVPYRREGREGSSGSPRSRCSPAAVRRARRPLGRAATGFKKGMRGWLGSGRAPVLMLDFGSARAFRRRPGRSASTRRSSSSHQAPRGR